MFVRRFARTSLAVSLVLAASLVLLTPSARAEAPVTPEACASAAEQAQVLREKRQLLSAREKFLFCAREACPKVVRDHCHHWLSEIDATVPSIVVRARDVGGHDRVHVRVSVDGSVVASVLDGGAIRLDPGLHHLRYETDGVPALEEDLLIAQGERGRVVLVTFANAVGSAESRSGADGSTSPASARSVTPWIVGGGGVAAIATFGVLQIVAQGEYSDLEDGCARTSSCTSSETDAVRTKFQLSAVALGIGVLALGTAAVLLLLAPPKGGVASARSARLPLLLAPLAPLRF